MAARSLRGQLKRTLLAISAGAEAAARRAARDPNVSRALEAATALLDRALVPGAGAAGFYGAGYFSGAGNPEEGKRSGYASYTRASSNADALAWVLAHHFELRSTLDVGCARGFLVEALRELGCEASGCDFSEYAINTAARGARGALRWADLSRGLPYDAFAFELVTCFETLEHLPAEAAVRAVAELGRVSSRYVVATMPSFGPRAPLPSGWFGGKVRPERQPGLEALGAAFDGPVEAAALAVDSQGLPLEGHLTIASFRWWRRAFEACGLVHCPEVEVSIYGALTRFNLQGFLDFYVFRHPSAPEPVAAPEKQARAREVLRPQVARRTA